MPPLLVIRRFPYEEPYHAQLEFVVSNGSFAAKIDIYCGVQDIARVGSSLAKFPEKVGDEYVYEYGSEDPTERCYRYFRLKAYTVGNLGNCAIQFKMNLNQSEPDEGVTQFSVKAEPSRINRLGDLLVAFSELKHLELQWSPSESCLLEAYTRDA